MILRWKLFKISISFAISTLNLPNIFLAIGFDLIQIFFEMHKEDSDPILKLN